MKTEKNVFRCFNPVLALCIMLVFAMLMSGCNDTMDKIGLAVKKGLGR